MLLGWLRKETAVVVILDSCPLSDVTKPLVSLIFPGILLCKVGNLWSILVTYIH